MEKFFYDVHFHPHLNPPLALANPFFRHLCMHNLHNICKCLPEARVAGEKGVGNDTLEIKKNKLFFLFQ